MSKAFNVFMVLEALWLLSVFFPYWHATFRSKFLPELRFGLMLSLTDLVMIRYLFIASLLSGSGKEH